MEEFLIHSIRTLWNLAHEFEILASSPIRNQVPPPARYLLRDCNLRVEQYRKRLLIEAPNRVTALALIKLRSRKRELAILAQNLELNWVTIYFQGTELMSFEGKMDILKSVQKAKKEYDECRLNHFKAACKLPPGCSIQMQLGTGILEIICESEDLVRHVWLNYRDYLPIEILTMERLWIRTREDKSQNPISLETLLETRRLREEAERFRKENPENQ